MRWNMNSLKSWLSKKSVVFRSMRKRPSHWLIRSRLDVLNSTPSSRKFSRLLSRNASPLRRVVLLNQKSPSLTQRHVRRLQTDCANFIRKLRLKKRKRVIQKSMMMFWKALGNDIQKLSCWANINCLTKGSVSSPMVRRRG